MKRNVEIFLLLREKINHFALPATIHNIAFYLSIHCIIKHRHTIIYKYLLTV